MRRIERHLGGPGTGKTRLILDRLDETKVRFGLSVHEIGLCTFTRAGRQELSERAAAEWGCDPETLTKHGWFRTAHSVAHRQCGIEEGQLLEGSEGAEWIGNAVGGKVATRFDPRSREVAFVSGDGDNSLTLGLKAWDLARANMTSLKAVLRRWALAGERVPDESAVRRYIERYEQAKRREGRCDYTDVIARFAGIRFLIDGPQEVDPEGEVPSGIRALAIDEAQDSSVLVDRVCRRLAESPAIERVFLSGDAYQSIYSFNGSDYRLFLNWDAEEFIMPRSYRCPPVVMQLGERCIQRMRHGYRDRHIQPASHSGHVRRAGSPEQAIAAIKPDESVLILGRCGFALHEYEDILRSKGIPYTWIDRVGSAVEMSGYACLWSLQHGKVVHHDDWANAISMIQVADKDVGQLLIRGEKQAWKKGLRSQVDIIRPVDEDFALAGATEAFAQIVREGRWPAFLDKSHAQKAERWVEAAKKFGAETACNPKVRLSTIHGAKGCEGDTVILSTVSSPAVERGRQAIDEIHDEECRVNYVAVTRARRDLWIVNDGDQYALEIPA
jgi:superfamily I DNA/RNA helicase